MHHLLDIESLRKNEIEDFLDRADHFLEQNRRHLSPRSLLAGYCVINLFFENSTRTRFSFELAARRLGADPLNFAAQTSSLKKGETLEDTAATFEAMGADVLVVRHSENLAPHKMAEHVSCSVINAGDGTHEHPTQALGDALVMRQHKGDLSKLTVAICGDVVHSRVARSNIRLLKKMGANIRVIGPKSFIPELVHGAEVYHDMKQGLLDTDIIMMLRIQRERMEEKEFPNPDDYFKKWGLDDEKLSWAKPGAMVMHPGPMNRGIEICPALADDPTHSLIKKQVEAGVAMRMAVLDLATRAKRHGLAA